MEVKFQLSKAQMEKLAKAHKEGTSVTLRLSNDKISATGIPLVLTATEIKKMQDGKSHDIVISASRVKSGGFLPALVAALPTIASVITGLSGLTGIASNIKDLVTGKSIKPTTKPYYEIQNPKCRCAEGNGFISDLNIPIISSLAKVVGLGNKKPRKPRKSKKTGNGLYLAP